MSAIIRIDPKQSQSSGVAESVQISGITPEQYESSLERQNFSQVIDLDFKRKCYFRDYLAPNERTPSKAREHLNWPIPGILISTGAVRSLFDLVLVDPEKCQGLVIRDINPRVKAYMDFEVLMIRLCNSHKQYQELADPILDPKVRNPEKELEKSAKYHERLEILKTLLSESSLCQGLKDYYFKHLENMATIYFLNQFGYDFRWPTWKLDDSFDEVNYYKHPELFYKIQKYAQEGKIIVTVGEIDDLEFLGDVDIGLIDMSNIQEYSFVDFKTCRSPQKIMWTEGLLRYYSHEFDPLSMEERSELSTLLEIIDPERTKPSGSQLLDDSSTLTIVRYCKLYTDRITSEKISGPIFACKKLLSNLRQYNELFRYFFEGQWIDLARVFSDLPIEQIEKFVEENKDRLFKIEKFFDNFPIETEEDKRKVEYFQQLIKRILSAKPLANEQPSL